MRKTGQLYQRIDRLFEWPIVFNAYQSLVDGGKTGQIKSFVKDVDYDSVVDVGCGTGNWATLADVPYLGVDTSPSFIAGCRRRYRGDRSKRFVQADASSLGDTEHFDLGMLISVLHHLSDAQVTRLVHWLARNVTYFFVLDLFPIPANPVSRFLYRMDRGNHIRSPEDQLKLLQADNQFTVLKSGDYFSPNRLYRHTLFLLQTNAHTG